MNAFSYMFKDKEFVKKALIYFMLAFIIQMIALIFNYKFEHKILYAIPFFLFYLYMSCVIFGYSISCSQGLIKNKENTELPFIKPWNDFIKGLKGYLGLFLQNLCLLLCAFTIGIPSAIIAIIIGILGGSKALMFLVGLLGVLVLLLLVLFLLIIIPALIYMYIKTERILSLINFKKACSIIKENTIKYFKAVGIICLVVIVLGVTSFVLQLGLGLAGTYNTELTTDVLTKILVYSLLVSVICVYGFFVSAYAVANCSDAEVE